MDSTWESILESLVAIRDEQFRSDPEREAARIDHIESVLQATLEKLARQERDANIRRFAGSK